MPSKAHRAFGARPNPVTDGRTPLAGENRPMALEATLEMTLCIVAAALATYVLISTAVIIRNAYFPIPLFDGWDTWRLFMLSKRYSSFLFSQHNEHRIALARVFFFIDHYVFHARSAFVLVCNSLVQALTAFCLWRLALRSGRFRRPTSALLGCFTLCCLFSGQQFTNLTWAFQIQFVAVYCTAVASILALDCVAKKHSNGRNTAGYFVLTCILGVLSTYSMANGLMVWPMLVALSFWLGLPVRFRIALGTAFAIMATIYLWGYHSPPQTADPTDSVLHHLPQVLAFSVTYLGSPIDPLATAILNRAGMGGDGPRVVCGAVAGATGTFAVLTMTIVLWRRRRVAVSAQVALLHVLFFILATSGLVGMGRVNFAVVEALTSRYVTPAMVFWVALVSLAWSLLAPPRLDPLRPRQALASAGLVGIMFFAIALHQPRWIQYSLDYATVLEQAQSAVVAGVYDDQPWHVAFHTPREIFAVVDYLRANRLSVFTEEWTHWTGKPLASRFTVDRVGACMGHFDQATVVPSAIMPGSRIAGWAWDTKAARGPETVVLADDTGVVAGVARSTFQRPDVSAAVPAVKGGKAGWRGYIAGLAARPITAYLLESDGKSLCSLGTLPTGLPVKETPFREVAGEVPDVAANVQGAWTRNGYYPDTGEPPISGAIYGSWSGDDGNIGLLRLGPFRVANQLAVSIPLYIGPKNGGLSVRVLNAKNGELISELAPPPLYYRWWAWRVDLPANVPSLDLEIVAEDAGRGWGEWLAIGMPHFVRRSAPSPTAAPK